MKLKKIYFDSFKSLVNEELEIIDNCTGIVGINESGKSNILRAIKILQEPDKLNSKDSPKITKNNPKLRFDFELNDSQKKESNEILNDWLKTNSLYKKEVTNLNFTVQYIIEFDLINEIETREFKIINPKGFGDDFLILKEKFIQDDFKFLFNGKYTSLQDAIVITKDCIEKNENEKVNFEEAVFLIKKEKIKLEKESEKIANLITANPDDENLLQSFEEINKKFKDLSFKEKNLNELLTEFNLASKKEKLKSEIEFLKKELLKDKKNRDSYSSQINTLKLLPSLNSSQKGTLTKYQNSNEVLIKSISKNSLTLSLKNKQKEDFDIPLKEKYTNDINILSFYFSKIIKDFLIDEIPKVIFWEYSKDYILKSETQFKDLNLKNKVSEISRPLMNIFRIGLNIKTIDELKSIIKTIQTDSDERSRIEDNLNLNLNEHIENIWPNYDQNIKISLEEHQIIIKFFDPKCIGRSYFKMTEKSQGAQTFISFLMTIGAEAAKGVLKNTILLLDEPEIHLHPSGVGYMLKELINISKKNNVVIYATHSIFMIDKSNFERHIYLKKVNEQTSIKPSQIDRIGFFMQEEVLYGALDIDLSKSLRTTNLYNFVFEGDGDVFLFKHYYENILKNPPLKINNCSFYQGGKCTDIIKYLKQNPIQLGTKWIFIIDNDDPAKNLKNFIESKYKNYLNKDIYLFQYSNEDKNNDNIELEDILSEELLKKSYIDASNKLKIDIEERVFDNVNWEKTNYNNFNNEIVSSLGLSNSEKIDFKKEFKTTLNSQIKLLINNNEIGFEIKFEKFEKWASEIIKIIQP